MRYKRSQSSLPSGLSSASDERSASTVSLHKFVTQLERLLASTMQRSVPCHSVFLKAIPKEKRPNATNLDNVVIAVISDYLNVC